MRVFLFQAHANPVGLFVLNWIGMTDSGLDTTIKVSVDADGVESGTTKVKRSLADMGKAASDVGKGTGAIGEGMERSATKVDSATKNMINSLQRQTAAMEAGDKTSRQYQESLARMRGIDVASLKPYLDQLDAAKVKQAEAAKSAESLATGMSAVNIAAVAVGASVGAFAMFSKGIIDAADGLNDLSQRVSISVRDLGKYQLAAEQSGSSLEAIAKGVKGLAKNMVENGDALRKAGIDATTADGAMQQLTDVFSEMPDGIEKTTLATKLFGKAGMDLIPMLNLGSDGLRDAAIASAEYAEQMAIMAPLADSLNDKMAEVALSSKTAGAIMVNELLPSLNKIADGMVSAKDSANSFATLMGGVVNVVVQASAVLISDVAFVLKGVGREIGGIAAQLAALGKLDFKGAGTISAAMKEDAANARKELDRWQSDLVNGVKKANDAAQNEYNKRQGFGYTSSSRGASLLGALGGDGEAKKAASELNKELEKQAGILAELSGYSKDYESTVQRYAAMLKSGVLNQDAFNRAVQELVAKQPGQIKLIKEQAEAQKILDKAIEETAKQWAGYQEQQQKSIIAADDEVTKAQASYDAHSKLASVIQEETLKRLENARSQIIGTEDTSVLDAQISAKRKLIDILTKGEVRDAGEKMAKDMAEEQKKAAEESGKYWEDALMRAFESGKGFFESLWSTIKNTLQTQVLKVLIAPATGALSGVASAATGSSGVLSGVGSLASMGAQFGSAASITMSNGMISGFGANMTNIAGQLASGSYTSALGMSLPYLGAAVAAFSALKSLGAFGSNFISATDSGRARIDYTATGIGGNAYNTTGDALQTAAAQKSVETLAQSYFKTAAQLGIRAMEATFELGSNTGREGAAPQTVLGVNIGKVGYSSGEISSGDAAGLQLAASRAIITALKASEMPAYLSKVFDDLTVSTATQDQISAALQYAGSLKTVRDALLETREPLQIVKDNVASAFASLGTSAETFKTDFVAAIDAGITGDALIAWQALGAGLDQMTASAKESARATAEWQTKIDIATGKTTQRDVEKAAALALADDATDRLINQFYELEDAAKAAEDAAKVAASLKAFGTEATKLGIELLTAEGKTQAATDALRTLETEGLSAVEVAAYDYNASLRAQITAVNDAKAAMAAYITTSRSLRDSFKVINNGGVAPSGVEAAQQAVADTLKDLNSGLTTLVDKHIYKPFFEAYPDAAAILASFSNTDITAAMATNRVPNPGGLTAADRSSPEFAAWFYEWANWQLKDLTNTTDDWQKAAGWRRPGAGYNVYTGTAKEPDPKFVGLSQEDALTIAEALSTAGNFGNYTPEQGALFASFATAVASLATAQNTATQSATTTPGVVQAIDTITESLKSAGDALMVQLLQAKGSPLLAGLAQKRIDTKDYTADQVALYDANEVLKKELATLNEKKGLQEQLNALTDTATQALTRQRDALDASNQALFDQVQAAKAATATAAANKSLQEQLDVLNGTRTQTEIDRANILAGETNATTLALQNMVWALQDLQAAEKQALVDLQKETTTAMTDMVKLWGDVTGAMAEIDPTKTLVDQWRDSSAELTALTQGLADALGELPAPTALDKLKTTLTALASATEGIANINSQIFDLKVSQGGQSAVNLLKGQEASLYAEMGTSNDPGSVASKLASTLIQRIKLEAEMADKAINDMAGPAAAIAKLEKESREAQITALQDQISAAQTLADVVGDLKIYIQELKFGDLSALNPTDQLSTAKALYASTLASAQGGDAKAMQGLQGTASSYLKEAQGYYGGATSQYAGIFGKVTGALDQYSQTPLSDIDLMTSQLDSLQAIADSTANLQTVTTDTSNLQIEGLTAISTALTSREADLKKDAADAKQAAQEQIAALQKIVDAQEAQIRQHAAEYEVLNKKLETIAASLESLDNTSRQTAAAPA